MPDFTRESIQQGRKNQDASIETPETFATIDGAAQVRPGRELSIQNQRMAGEVGARALSLMTNEEEIARTADWMAKFENNAPQAREWKEAKMGGMAPPPM